MTFFRLLHFVTFRPNHQLTGLPLLCLLWLTACIAGPTRPIVDFHSSTDRQRHLLIVLDGLRPDYVTPELMPNLHALGKRGVVFGNHHAVFPTVTRVNAASISTGAYPETHGLLGNSVYFPAVDESRFLDTGDRKNLLSVEQTEPHGLLTAPTLGEQLHNVGLSLLVVSAGSTGSSYLLNHTVAGGGIIHYDYTLPTNLMNEVARSNGNVPPADTPNDARNRYVIDAFFQVGIPRINPDVTIMWLSEPDASAHAHGIGHPITQDSLARLDDQLREIQERLETIGWSEHLNIWVTSDHGFSTHTGGVQLDQLLAPFNGTLEDGSPRIVARSGAIYVRDGDQDTVTKIVSSLQSSPKVGAIFTRGLKHENLHEGSVPGTLSFKLARWQHARGADILFSGNWTGGENEFGYPGKSAQNGVAGHGSSSPFDIHNTLIAAGPLLKSGITTDLPTGNVDFSPTLLSLLGVPIPDSMQGRVLSEAFLDGPEAVAVKSTVHRVQSQDGLYQLKASISDVDGHSYLDYTKVERQN